MRVSGDDRVGQAMGYSVEMTCHVEAYPPPTITWVHDGIQLSSNQVYSVDSGYTTTDDFTETRVTIKELRRRQLGTYQCKAQNKLGQAEQTIEVYRSNRRNCLVGACDEFGGAAAHAASGTLSLFATIFSWLFYRYGYANQQQQQLRAQQ